MSVELKAELGEWCKSYTDAFSAYDVSVICDHWAFPATVLSGGRSIAFRDREKFEANTNALMSFYKAQAVARADRTIMDAMLMSSNVASMKVADRMLTEDGKEIVSWRAAYVLHRIGADWRAVLAVADGEMQAWQANGTPMGG